MRLIATGLLFLMAVLYAVSRSWEPVYPGLVWLRAFAEAAMVGALADWFAVVALFRKPLGFPWHTAIIPRKKDQIGESLALFVQTNFLSADRIIARLSGLDLSRRLADWLAQEENASRVAQRITTHLPSLLDGLGDRDMQHFIRERIVERARLLPLAPAAGRVLGILVEGDHHLQLFEQVVTSIRTLVGENRDFIREKIRKELDELPIRVGDFDPLQGAKEGISNSASKWVVDRIQRTLDEVHDDRNHRLRHQFSAKTEQFVRDLKESPEMERKAAELRDRLLDSPQLQQALDSVWQSIKTEIQADCAKSDSSLQQRLATIFRQIGSDLSADPDFRAKLDLWIRQSVTHLVSRHGHEIGDLIRDTVKGWDGREIADKIENQVGSDLQFIRINGTLVGGLVGVAIHGVSRLLWP